VTGDCHAWDVCPANDYVEDAPVARRFLTGRIIAAGYTANGPRHRVRAHQSQPIDTTPPASARGMPELDIDQDARRCRKQIGKQRR
jgi:hypothetical protein